MPRVLVAAFALEANTFAPGSTTLDDFRAQVWRVGDDAGPDALGPSSELAAAWRVLAERGCEVVPAFAAWSAPRQPLAAGVVAELVELLLARCDDGIDGAYLMLHGSAVAHDDDDPEGTLLGALRERLGPGRSIAISLDLHAHLTPAMAGAVDVIAAYRTCPHVDTERTGAQAAALLVDALEGRARPVVAVAARPMITPPERHDHEQEPFASLMAACAAAERGPVLSAGLLAVQPWIDVPGLSWKAFAVADGDRAAAHAAAERIADAAWGERAAFLDVSGIEPAAALDAALALPSPVVFADAGDATNGGAVGDSTELLRAALARPGADAPRVLLSVTDPAAAAQAVAAGEGATIDLQLGTGRTGSYNARTPLAGARVLRTAADAAFAHTHPVNAGYRTTAGPSALVAAGGLHVVVHTRSVGVIDPAIYAALGADPAAFDVVQAKSHVSYRAGFAPVTERAVLAATPGPTTADLATLDYVRRLRPLFPFEA